MSKKKAFVGNTMTLKDFHGGSIPTDLPLPSAPGVIVRPTDRSGYDRATSWGNPIGRPDHRARPNSSLATRHLDDKTPFLTNSVHIGRNFDEDERTPLDGAAGPRRTVSDESFRVPASRVDLKPESAYAGRISGRHGSAPVFPLSSGGGHSYSSRVSEAAHVSIGSQSSGGNHRQAASGSYPNAWMSRKEMSSSVVEPVQSASSEQSAVSKLAHASALEKVSSGRWQSKQSLQYQKDIDVSKHSAIEKDLYSQVYDDKMYSRTSAAGGREYSDVTLARHVEKGSNIEDGIQGGRKELPDYERNCVPNHSEVKEKKSIVHGEGVQSTHSDGKFSGYELQSSPSVLSEASERPKLNLIPRTKPLDRRESPIFYPKQGHQRLSESVLSHTEIGNNSHGHVNTSKHGLVGSEIGNQQVERPKLNLKPRSQPVEQLEGIEKERNALFGGARPRELVLKERGVDDSNREPGQHPERVKHNVLRTEKTAEPAAPRHGERVENHSVEQRAGRKSERNHRVDNGRVDTQRRNWRNENRQNGRETERQQQQLPQGERQPSPETWRKPAEKPKPVSPEAAGVRYGKATSALELAQAFSKSFSDPNTTDDQHAGQRGLPARTQMPFSRLMGPTPRPQINGY